MERTKPVVCWMLALALLLGAVVAGCGDGGGGDAGKGKATGPEGGKAAVAPAKGPLSAEAWVEKVMDCYKGALKDTVAAMEGSTPAEALPKLREVKEKYIGLLVPLGREREAMEKGARSQAEAALVSKMMRMSDDESFKKYNTLSRGAFSAFKAKTAEEKEAAEIVASVNIITQYAQFELLKKQAPKEAERLGIE